MGVSSGGGVTGRGGVTSGEGVPDGGGVAGGGGVPGGVGVSSSSIQSRGEYHRTKSSNKQPGLAAYTESKKYIF